MLPKLAISITSFIPLYILMAILYGYGCLSNTTLSIDTRNSILMVIVIIFIIQLLLVYVVARYIQQLEDHEIQDSDIIFKDIKEDKKAYIDYMMTYLLPLLIFDPDKINWFYILYTNMLILIFIFINANSENFNFNILLWAKGYHIYKGNNNFGEEKTLLIKKKKFSNIRSNNSAYKFISFGGSQDIFICRTYLQS